MIVPLTPLDFKQRAVRLFGNKVGVVDGTKRFTYREFGDRASRLAGALLTMGLRRGDRVAFLAYNSHPLLEAYYGVLEADGILLPLNIRLSATELAYILEHSGSRFLFVDPDFAGLRQEVFAQMGSTPTVVWLGTPPTGGSEPEYDALLAASEPLSGLTRLVDENAVAELFYTSGTTGRPKGVMLTHRNLYLHALSGLVTIPTNDSDVQLHTIPLFHVNGWGTPQSVTAAGGTHVMLRKFDPAETFRLIEAERVTRFFAVPTMLTMLLNHPDASRCDLTSLRAITLGGAPAPPEMIRRAEEVLGCAVFSGYGLSETSPVVTHAAPKAYLSSEGLQERIARQASAGLPVVGVDLRIVDEHDQDLAWNGKDVGEIVVRSNNVMAGYWDDPDASKSVIRDGWFYTGDMATVDTEGYVHIVDRKKDIIISGGENIASVEIEKVLYEYPAVLESAVLGIPDETWGEVPVALVTLRPGSAATAEEIIEFCRSRLASFKVPKSVEFRAELPKGGTGKILKRELREPYWRGRAKRVG